MRLLVLAAALTAVGAMAASASVHVTYDVYKEFPGGTSASWVHSATLSPINGSAGNGAYVNGDTSSRIAGSLEGDLTGNQLRNVSGIVSGKLKQFSDHLLDVGAGSYEMSTPFEVRLGVAAGGTGALEFGTNGAGGAGPFTGGYVDFALIVDGSRALGGTLFFKPQAETASTTLSPNRGDSSAFTLWGWNWMHDGAPMDGSGSGLDWPSFLGSLGYGGSTVQRPDLAGATLGITLYASDSDPPHYVGNPEPTAFLIWGLLASMATVFYRRSRPSI